MDGEVTRRQCRISSRIGELLPIMYVENPSLCERSITIARGCGHRTAMSTVAHPTVVVVNDDPVQLHVTSSLIERDGMRVIPCSGAEEALRILTQNGHVDVIVTDLHMPGIDGWRFCRLLRSPEYAAFNHVPILVISATLSGSDAQQVTVDLGANAFLSAPFDAGTLRACMQDLLNGRIPQATMRVLMVVSPSIPSTQLRSTFERYGCVVELAATAEEARARFKDHEPEVVVLDYDLPTLGDHQLLRTVKAPGSSSIALVVTGDPTPSRALDAMRAGADAYIRKPYDPEYVISLGQKARRERALLRVEELLENRTVSLRDSETRFRTLVEGVVEIILVSDDQDKIQYINQVGAQRLEWTADQLIGRPRSTILPPDSPACGDGTDAGAQHGETRVEATYCTRTGRRVEVEVSRRPFVFNNGTAVMTVARDITERKRAEQEKTRLQEQLRHSQKMEAIGTLAGGVAHDFNNLLTVIFGHVHLIKMRSQPSDEGYKDAATIETVVYRARALTEQLLGFARRGKHENTVTDVRATIREVMTFLSRTLDKKIILKEESGVEAAAIMGDPGQLHQVILNLSVNARDAMPDGGQITYRTEVMRAREDIRKRLPSLTADEYVVISVSDTGCGIPAELRERIFEPFFTTKDHRSGTGMGLAMVYGIVQNHGGIVDVDSSVGEGTTFKLYLPRVRQLDRRAKPRTEEPLVTGTGRILLVDDEELVRKIAARLLSHLGYEVVMACDGREAVDYYRQHSSEVALVILDMIMPQMSGRECFRELRAINPQVKTVLISGYDKNHGAQEILDEGVRGFIQKPYDLNKFSRVIAQAIDTDGMLSVAPSA